MTWALIAPYTRSSTSVQDAENEPRPTLATEGVDLTDVGRLTVFARCPAGTFQDDADAQILGWIWNEVRQRWSRFPKGDAMFPEGITGETEIAIEIYKVSSRNRFAITSKGVTIVGGNGTIEFDLVCSGTKGGRV